MLDEEFVARFCSGLVFVLSMMIDLDSQLLFLAHYTVVIWCYIAHLLTGVNELNKNIIASSSKEDTMIGAWEVTMRDCVVCSQ